MSLLLEVSLEYLRLGFRPLPVRSREKSPALGSWRNYQERAPTEAELTTWFANSTGNMGTVIPPGWIVVDLDGGKSAEALLVAAGVTLPESAWRVATGGGGYHVYLALPPGVADFPKLPGRSFLHATDANGQPCKPFVEILTAGNFVVLPPSMHESGTVYAWTTEPDDMLATVPDGLMELIATHRAPAPAPSAPASTHGNEPGWVEQLSRGTGPHTHDDSMTKLAGYYLSRRMSPALVIDIIESGYAKRCWNSVGPDGTPVPCVIARADIERVVNSVARAEARKPDATPSSDAPFAMLGYDHAEYYYLSRASGQLVRLRSEGHTRAGLLRIADARYWDNNFATKDGVSWTWAQSTLLAAQHAVGAYDPDRLRGRGAWFDERDGAVIHTGEAVVIRGASVPVRSVPAGRYIYELSRPLGLTLAEPLSASEARQLFDLFSMLSWEQGANQARLAAGWCVCAVVCGALPWRPHLWLTGPSGSGKSYIMDSIIRPLLGKMALNVLGSTTEAGIRQMLGCDALPVIFDEAESKGKRGPERVQAILELMRQASSEGDGVIIKGSADGEAHAFRIRSCFMLSSINVSAHENADRNRITLVNTRIDHSKTQEERDEDFANICHRVVKLLDDDFCAKFRSRCVKLIPVIRENARILSVAAAGIIGSRRLGDQIGTLLAGAYSLLSDTMLTPDEAIALVEEQDLSEQKELRSAGDEQTLWNAITDAVVDARGNFGTIKRTVWELMVAIHDGGDREIGPADAEDALGRIGIRIVDGSVAIACSNAALRRILAETPWAQEYALTLMRVPGAERRAVRIAKKPTKCVLLPESEVTGYK